MGFQKKNPIFFHFAQPSSVYCAPLQYTHGFSESSERTNISSTFFPKTEISQLMKFLSNQYSPLYRSLSYTLLLRSSRYKYGQQIQLHLEKWTERHICLKQPDKSVPVKPEHTTSYILTELTYWPNRALEPKTVTNILDVCDLQTK